MSAALPAAAANKRAAAASKALKRRSRVLAAKTQILSDSVTCADVAAASQFYPGC